MTRAPARSKATRSKDSRSKAAGKPRSGASTKSRAMQKKSAAPKKGGFGTQLLSPADRARYEARAFNGHLLAAGWARFKIRTDDNRRLAAGRRDGIAATDHTGAGRKDRLKVTTAGYTIPGGGMARSVAAPPEWRATTAQVAGLWPWSIGAGAPVIGTPLGRHLDTGEPVCFDPLNWFTRGGFLTAPSLFVLGLNGFGKSSLVRRIVLGGLAQGSTPLVLADVKPDYRDTIELCGGQVIDLGYGHGQLNVLDPSVMGQTILRLDTAGMEVEASSLRAELRARTTNLVGGLVELVRGERISDFEDTLISTSLRVLFAPTSEGGRGFTLVRPPILEDMASVIGEGSPELWLDAAAHTAEQYEAAIIPLRRSLRALTQGPFGSVFNGPTTTPLDLDSVGICIDVSHIPRGDKKLKAAVMLACWSQGFGAVEALNLLAEVGLAPQRYFQVVMDELWQVLGLGEFMIERVDEVTRLQRSLATALIMISHSIRDLQALGAAADRAVGFLERSRAKILGALPADELAALDGVVKLTAAEVAMVTSWSAPQGLTGEPLRRDEEHQLAAGVGKFLLKVGEDRRPGIPLELILTAIERETGIHDTSKRFAEFGRPKQDRAAS